jgi:shikimate kinase
VSASCRPVFLVGFMGAGKSTAGRHLAEIADREFVDTDRLIERHADRAIDAIFTGPGEGRFRELEWEALQGLAGRTDLVVAAGGGAFLGHAQRAWMRGQGISVWLDAPLQVLRERLPDGGGRPLWSGDDPVALRAMFDKRRAIYALADLRVDASAGSPDEVARQVLKRIIRISG